MIRRVFEIRIELSTCVISWSMNKNMILRLTWLTCTIELCERQRKSLLCRKIGFHAPELVPWHLPTFFRWRWNLVVVVVPRVGLFCEKLLHTAFNLIPLSCVFFSGRPIYGNGDEKIKLSLHCLRSRAHRNHQTFPIKSSNNNISTVNFLDIWRDILWIHFNCLSLLPLFIFRFDNMKMHSPKTSRKQTHTQKLTVPRYSSDIFRHMCVWIFYCVKKFLE